MTTRKKSDFKKSILIYTHNTFLGWNYGQNECRLFSLSWRKLSHLKAINIFTKSAADLFKPVSIIVSVWACIGQSFSPSHCVPLTE